MDEKITVPALDVSVVKTAEKEIVKLIEDTGELAIRNNDDFENAGSVRAKAKGYIKRLDERRKEITVPLDNAKKSVMALFSPLTEKLEGLISVIDKETVRYSTEQEEIARKKQEEENERARKEEERIRKEKEAQEAAWREKEEKARKEREELEKKAREAKSAKERASLEAEAKKKAAEEAKAAEKAQERASEAANVQVEAAVVETEAPKATGQGIKELWYAEVVDETKIPREYLMPNMEMLNKQAKATKNKKEIPGVVFKMKKIVSGRSA